MMDCDLVNNGGIVNRDHIQAEIGVQHGALGFLFGSWPTTYGQLIWLVLERHHHSQINSFWVDKCQPAWYLVHTIHGHHELNITHPSLHPLDLGLFCEAVFYSQPSKRSGCEDWHFPVQIWLSNLNVPASNYKIWVWVKIWYAKYGRFPIIYQHVWLRSLHVSPILTQAQIRLSRVSGKDMTMSIRFTDWNCPWRAWR